MRRCLCADTQMKGGCRLEELPACLFPGAMGKARRSSRSYPPAPRVSGLTDTRLGQSPWDFQLCLGCWKDLGGITWKESWQRRVRTHQPQDQHGKREICTEQVEADLQWAQCPKGFSIMDLFLQI